MDPIDGSADEARTNWARYLRQKRCFGFSNAMSSGIGTFPEMQLLNPIGSRVTAHVYQIEINPPGGLSVGLQAFDSPLATDLGAGPNFWLGGPPSQCHLFQGAAAVLDGTTILLVYAPTPANMLRYDPWVCVLEPGKGIVAVAYSTNNTLGAQFFWAELPA